MSTFRLTILGNGSALPTVNTHHSAHILNVCEQFYLVDCGEGTQRQMLKAGIHPLKVNCIFLSHLHGDHIFGLFPLLSSLGMMGRKQALKIFAPAAMEQLLEHYYKFYDDQLPYEIQFFAVDTREHKMIFENKVMEVWSIPLRHKIPTSGYHFKQKELPRNVRKEKIEYYNLSIPQILALKDGEDITLDDGRQLKNKDLTLAPPKPRSYAYLSDTNYSAKAAGLISGVSLLYHEATFCSEDKATAKKTGHSTSTEAGRCAITAEAEKLLIGHLSPRYKDEQLLLNEAKEVFANTFLAEELKSYDI